MILPRMQGIGRWLALGFSVMVLLLGGCASEKPVVATQEVSEVYDGKLIPVNEPVASTSSIAEPARVGGGEARLYPGDMQNYARVKQGGAVPFSGAPPDAQLANNLLDQSDEQTGFSK